MEEPNQVGRYYKDLLPRIGKDIFNSSHSIEPYYTAAFAAFRLEWLFRNRRIDTKYKQFRFQLGMAVRLMIEKDKKLRKNKKMTGAYCAAIDQVMFDVETSQIIFERGIAAVDATIRQIGAQADSRTAKMRDMRDNLREQILRA